MKNIKLLSILVFTSLIFFSCNDNKTTKQDTTETKIVSGKNRVEILDFYGTHRCTTCINIEANTQYTLDVAFEDEVNEGILSFKTINFDDEENEEIVTEYLAYGTSLYLNIVKDGIEEHIDITDFAFKWANEKVEYSMQLEEKINEALAKL